MNLPLQTLTEIIMSVFIRPDAEARAKLAGATKEIDDLVMLPQVPYHKSNLLRLKVLLLLVLSGMEYDLYRELKKTQTGLGDIQVELQAIKSRTNSFQTPIARIMTKDGQQWLNFELNWK